MMKKTMYILPFMLLTAALCHAEKQEEKIVAKYLVNGYFFESMPTLPAILADMGADSVFVLTDKEGNKVQSHLFYADLPDSIVRKAVPKKRVVNGKFFIREDEYQRRMARENQTFDGTTATHDIIPRVGRLFPLFRERDILGKEWTFKDLLGHPTVLYLWDATCMTCMTEMNELSIWKQMYPDVLFLSATWSDVATVKRLTQQYNFTWLHLAGAQQITTWVTQGIVSNNGITCRTSPITIVIDNQGLVRYISGGTGVAKRQTILDYIRRLR